MRSILGWFRRLIAAKPESDPAEEVRALLAVLRAADVELFEGRGVRVVFRPVGPVVQMQTGELHDRRAQSLSRLADAFTRARAANGSDLG
jgi:hypothetical protein